MIVPLARAVARHRSMGPIARLAAALRELAGQFVGLLGIKRQDADGAAWVPVLTVVKKHEAADAVASELKLEGLGIDGAGRDGDRQLGHDAASPSDGLRRWAKPVMTDRGPWRPVMTCCGVPMGCRAPDILTDRDGADHA